MHIVKHEVSVDGNGTWLVPVPNNARGRVCHVLSDLSTAWSAGSITIHGAVSEEYATAASGVLLDTVAFGDAPDIALLTKAGSGIGPREPWMYYIVTAASMTGDAHVHFAFEIDN